MMSVRCQSKGLACLPACLPPSLPPSESCLPSITLFIALLPSPCHRLAPPQVHPCPWAQGTARCLLAWCLLESAGPSLCPQWNRIQSQDLAPPIPSLHSPVTSSVPSSGGGGAVRTVLPSTAQPPLCAPYLFLAQIPGIEK